MSSQQRGRGFRGRYGRGRAGFSGRMRGGMGGSWRKPQVAEPPAPPVGSILTKIHDDDLQDISGVDGDTAGIPEFTEVASFNWLNEKRPTIFIPGQCLCRNEDGVFGLNSECVGAPPRVDAIAKSNPVERRRRRVLS